MDSSNSYSFSRNFRDLLNTEENNNNLESLPSFSPPIQNSQFSVQYSEGSDFAENSRQCRRRWTASEDIVLISAWLNTSKDPIVGNEQRSVAFWERIAAYYAATEAVAGKPERGSNQCKQRWKKINESVNKFVGCYRQASARRSSGQSESDVLQKAHELYLNDHHVKFSLEHAWRKLINEQKWCSDAGGNDNTKRTKLNAAGTYSSSSNTSSRVEEEDTPRPQGVKAAKRKAKKGETSHILQLQEMCELKEKDIVLRQRLSKERLLDSLISKADLSEDEINLKKKLIDEMLK